jgi:S-adenosylhomocysteine hydrolase
MAGQDECRRAEIPLSGRPIVLAFVSSGSGSADRLAGLGARNQSTELDSI